jgi:hypothetical protein
MLASFNIRLQDQKGRVNEGATAWYIVHDQTLSMLELLYAQHQAKIARCGAEGSDQLPGGAEVKQLLLLHKAKFQWTPLTGVAAPYEEPSVPQWQPAQLKSKEEMVLEQRQRKRRLSN